MVAVASFFAESYAEARQKFLDAVGRSGAVLIDSHRNPTLGPDGGALFTDVARIGPANAKKLLVLNSATHGIEGYCGSGCQVGWLLKGHYHRDAQPDTAVILVHAINPHGFAWGRRVTEENVDLNRNFLDHGKPHPQNADYEVLAEHINPIAWTPESLAKADAAIARHYGLPNADFLPSAVHGGQYVNAKGTFYGGDAPTWANRIFRAILAGHCSGAAAIGLIDYHTGLGPLGHGDLRFRGRRHLDLARSWYDEVSTVPGAGATWHVPSGLLALALDESLAQRTTVPMVIEYGTYDVNSVLKAIRADNWLHCHGDLASPQGREIKAFMREMFYPSVPEWKIMVFSRSNDVIRQALVGLAKT
ncbi:MAG: DUF2817 domain-containing protein [Proteobacteria bacterium]|nr:DUF2817 domain-containing protein [Pseudomonadota bacterium]MBI3495720.1 DUF2817 domain-containing protein [Pseudomonadota bacterium]